MIRTVVVVPARLSGLLRSTAVQYVLLVIAISAAILIDLRAPKEQFFDLAIYRGAISAWLHNGVPLYDYVFPDFPDWPLGFTYPPFAAVVMAPLAMMPWSAAVVVSCAIDVAALVAVAVFFAVPMARRYHLAPVPAVGICVCAIAVLDPVLSTILIGQVNLVLVLLVLADLWLLKRNSRLAGMGIGLATAVKLTPGLFVVYLLLARRWRAAAVSIGTFLLATLSAVAVDPGASRRYWTGAVWETSRVGPVNGWRNQSLNGAIARAIPHGPHALVWLVSCAVVVACWAWRLRGTAAIGDDTTGFALTGVAGCLLSPITWVHHLVWFVPALIVLFDGALQVGGRRGRVLLGSALLAWAILASKVVAHFPAQSSPFAWAVGNAYVFAGLALLFLLPIRRPVAPEPTSGEQVVLSAADPRFAGV